jgi:hypothetical protein
LRFSTAKLRKEARTEVEKVFKSFDINGVGKFTVLELKKVAEYIGEYSTDE